MTAHDEARAKCIDAQAKAYYESKRHINVTYKIPTWDELGPISKKYKINRMTDAFDALHGIARVTLPAVTKEMSMAVHVYDR